MSWVTAPLGCLSKHVSQKFCNSSKITSAAKCDRLWTCKSLVQILHENLREFWKQNMQKFMSKLSLQTYGDTLPSYDFPSPRLLHQGCNGSIRPLPVVWPCSWGCWFFFPIHRLDEHGIPLRVPPISHTNQVYDWDHKHNFPMMKHGKHCIL